MRIFLDQDGPLADFEKKKLQTFGTLKVPDGLMWHVINRYFPEWFFELPPSKDMDELWAFFKPYNPTILTAAPRKTMEHVANQKRRWIDMHLNALVPMICCLRSEKKNYCTSQSDVLIDDNIKNIQEWCAKGGIGIYHTDAKNSIRLFQMLTARFTPL